MPHEENVLGFRYLFKTDDPQAVAVRLPCGGEASTSPRPWIVRQADYESLINCKSGLLQASRESADLKDSAAAAGDEISRWFYPWKD